MVCRGRAPDGGARGPARLRDAVAGKGDSCPWPRVARVEVVKQPNKLPTASGADRLVIWTRRGGLTVAGLRTGRTVPKCGAGAVLDGGPSTLEEAGDAGVLRLRHSQTCRQHESCNGFHPTTIVHDGEPLFGEQEGPRQGEIHTRPRRLETSVANRNKG